MTPPDEHDRPKAPEPVGWGLRVFPPGAPPVSVYGALYKSQDAAVAAAQRHLAKSGPTGAIPLYGPEAFAAYEAALKAAQTAENNLRNEMIAYRNVTAIERGGTIAKCHAAGQPAPATNPEPPREVSTDPEKQR
jgi:hypothetical protein